MELSNSQGLGMPPQQPVPEKRRYGEFLAVAFSFFSAELYRDVAARWRGIGFRYLVLLMLLTSIPEAIKFQVWFADFLDHDAQPLIDDFPTLSILNGEVSIAEADPYLWRDPKTGQVLLYIDTSGAFDRPEAPDATFRLSRKELQIRNTTPPWIVPVARIEPFLTRFAGKSGTIDKLRLRAWLDWWAKRIGIVYFALAMITGIIGHLLQIFIYGVFGLVICAILGVTLDYSVLVRLALVALTPACVLGTLLILTGISIPFSNPLFFVIEISFLAFAVKANGPDPFESPEGFHTT